MWTILQWEGLVRAIQFERKKQRSAAVGCRCRGRRIFVFAPYPEARGALPGRLEAWPLRPDCTCMQS